MSIVSECVSICIVDEVAACVRIVILDANVFEGEHGFIWNDVVSSKDAEGSEQAVLVVGVNHSVTNSNTFQVDKGSFASNIAPMDGLC